VTDELVIRPLNSDVRLEMRRRRKSILTFERRRQRGTSAALPRNAPVPDGYTITQNPSNISYKGSPGVKPY
jgi:hypothetical protein